jgi:SAM-dependent methyltransferase
VTTAWQPLGAALRAYHEGERDARLTVESDLFETEEVPASAYYRPSDSPLPALERAALDICAGRVLDAGAGAGRHALELQTRGFEVTALEIDPTAASVMRSRGVERVIVGDLRSFPGGPFDTVLMLMNGLGAVGTIAGLHDWFERLHRLVGPDGSVVCDSTDLAGAFDRDELSALRQRSGDGPDRGETSFRLTFRECRGAWYRWLFCPEDLVRRSAEATGWKAERLHLGDRGAFLVRLRPHGR